MSIWKCGKLVLLGKQESDLEKISVVCFSCFSYTFDESSSFLSPSDYDDTKDDILVGIRK